MFFRPLCTRSNLKQFFNRSLATHAHNQPKPGSKVVVGMSGGVDSSVAARLLANQDYDLSAIFMRNWDTRDESGTDNGCEWEKDWNDVQRVCTSLGIPCSMIDLSREYWHRIFQPALDVWESGLTPNPDVWCNREIKFGALLERLPGSSWFATGHYARKQWSSNGRPQLLSARDQMKDQAYYLSSISEQGLARALFPLGEITKAEVRELARSYQLETAERPESMGLCFVGEKGRFSHFLNTYLKPHPGPIIDFTTRKIIGQHEGLWTYTIGEKVRVGGQPMKTYVFHKDTAKNIIYVVPGGNHEALLEPRVICTNWKWIWSDSPPAGISDFGGFRCTVKVRHRQENQSCIAKIAHDGTLEIIPDEPFRGVSPGQVAALWDGDWCLGCGIITESQPPPQLHDFNVSQRPRLHKSPQVKKKKNGAEILPRKQGQPHHITQGSPQAPVANSSAVGDLDKQAKKWQWWK